jgi:hypothetical protein
VANTVPPAVAAAVLIMHDTFTALPDETTLEGWTPDTANTPGNNWSAGSGTMKGDGLGNVEPTINGGAGTYDTEITDDLIRVEALVTSVGSLRIFRMGILTEINWNGPSVGDGLYIEHTSTTLALVSRVSGSGTTLASTTVARSADTPNTYRIQYDGTDVKTFFDDVEVTALTQEGYTPPAGLTGMPFVGIGGQTSILVHEFKVWDLP